MAEFPTIAIIGGGLSGSMVALNLLQLATVPLTIKLIECRSELGRGVAYSTPVNTHLLNIPASSASLFEDDPNDFYRWAKRAEPLLSVTPNSFLPRRLYGRYVKSVLYDVVEISVAQLVHIYDEAIAIRHPHSSHPLEIELAGGQLLQVDYAILALGNFPPGNPPVADNSFYNSPRYIASAWSNWDLCQIAPDDPVALIGTGLTAVDVTLQLRQQGHHGTIHWISRRGLLPHAHRFDVPQSACPIPDDLPKTARAYVHAVRQAVDLVNAESGDWRSVFDGLRPEVQRLWRSLPLQEQQRLLRHILPYWSIHRHRVAPEVAQQIEELVRSQHLKIHAGRILHYHPTSEGVIIELRSRSSSERVQIPTAWVINCTGSEGNYHRVPIPLIMELLHSGLATSHPLGIGLNVSEDGALINATGLPSTHLYTLGPPLQGLLWETTAIPEIRQQAPILAGKLLRLINQNFRVTVF